MLVVPLEKDRITTVDGQTYRVIFYTNYKDGGPAVYARDKESKTPVLVYFFDIDAINGTKVEYQRSQRVFRALGKIDRVYQLPQPDDNITVMTNKMTDEEGKERVEVESLKLKAKSLGISKGMFVKDTEGEHYRLNQILDIDRAVGGEHFDRDAFMKYYKDYAGA